MSSRQEIDDLTKQARAALVASTLTRVTPLAEEVGQRFKSFRLPAAAITEAFEGLARQERPLPIAWRFDEELLEGCPVALRDISESLGECFGLAAEALNTPRATAELAVLESVEELVEALANLSADDVATKPRVSIDVGVADLVLSERQMQRQQVDVLRSSVSRYVPKTLATLMAESRSAGKRYLQLLRAALVSHNPDMTAPASLKGSRADGLMAVLRTFSGADWAAVEACAAAVDRKSALVASRPATKAVGFSRAHDLLMRITRELALPERGAAWDIVSGALLAAAAWDELDGAARDELTKCLRGHQGVERLIKTW